MRSPVMHSLARVGLGLCCAAWAGPKAAAAEFQQNFAGGPPYEKSFRQTGPDASRAIKAEPPGLRISLGADHGKKPAVGLVARFGVRGDFEITLAYELLRVEKPTGGNGAGVSVWITMVSPTKEAATIARVTRPGGEQVFISHRASTPVGGPREHHGGKPLPTDSLSGKLRLVRKGPTLIYFVASGDSRTFQELYQFELGTADLDTVRFAADNGGSPTTVDVRLKSATIVADGLGSVQSLPPPPRWPVRPAIGLGVVLLTAGGLWLWWRSRRANGIVSPG